MPSCDGLPHSKCPQNASGKSVIDWCDLWLCPTSFDTRFPPEAQSESAMKTTNSESSNTNAKTVDSDVDELSSQITNDNKTEEPILLLEPVLCYTYYSLQNSSYDSVKAAVIGHFSLENILKAKDKLWEVSDSSVIGDKIKRRATNNRNEKEAIATDIINAIQSLAKANKAPIFVIDAMSLGMIPRSRPEEMNDISLVDRLNKFEGLMKRADERLDNVEAENAYLRSRLEQNLCRPTQYEERLEERVHKLESETIRTQQKSYAHVLSTNTSSNATVGLQKSNIVSQSENIQSSSDEQRSAMSRPISTATPAATSNIQQAQWKPPRVAPYHHTGRGGFSLHTKNRFSALIDRYRSPDRNSIASDRSLSNDRDSVINPTTDGYRYVNNNSRRRNRHEVTGKAAISTTSGFRGAPEPSRDLFISRVDISTEDSKLKEFLKSENFTIRHLECISNSEAKFKSYKLTVPVSQFRSLFDADMWPNGIRVRQFFAKKSS